MAYLLRHGAQREGLAIRADGYMSVEALLRHRDLRDVDFALLEEVVQSDQKGRYDLMYEPHGGSTSAWWIRANQGHSMPDVTPDLRRVTMARELPVVVHGTTMRAWESIATQGLSRMGRNHIHFARGLIGDGDVVSGMRASSEILVYVDARRALGADIKFYVSKNGVVLSPGNELGFLEPRFFLKVERVKVSAEPIPGWAPREEPEYDEEEADDGAVPHADPRPPRNIAKENRKIRHAYWEKRMRGMYPPEELELV